MSDTTPDEHTETLRQIALKYPEVNVGTACTRTSFKARKKSFLFTGTKDTTYTFMIKLDASVPEAIELAKQSPDHYNVGKHGWVTVTLPLDHPLPPGLAERWIDESYRANATKKLLAQLPPQGPPAA